MHILRWLAGVCFLVAALAIASDVTKSRSSGHVVTTSAAAHWRALSPQSLTSAQQAITRNVHAAAWDAVVARALLLPTSAVFATLGVALALLGRRKNRVNIFTN